MNDHDSILQKARRHLMRKDPVLKRLIGAVGPCTLCFNDDRFGILVRSIVSQQISGKAAASISAKFIETLHPHGLRPEAILALEETRMREAGLSRGKVKSIRDLSQKVHEKLVSLDDIHDLDDEEVIQRLIPVHGIGRWTAEMFLIFSLGRLDVLPVADLGLRVGVQRQYRLRKPLDKVRLTKIAEPWRPYRSIATWYIWRSFGAVPQS